MEKVALLEQISIIIIFASILLVLQGLINGSIFAMGQQRQINFSAIPYNQDRDNCFLDKESFCHSIMRGSIQTQIEGTSMYSYDCEAHKQAS